jgi:hypothetical protein
MKTAPIFISMLIAALCAVTLSGCGLAMGKRVDFGSDYKTLGNGDMKDLAGKTYFITNDDDYQQLVALKSELRNLANSGKANPFDILDKTSGIKEITKHYYSGVLGAIYPSRWEIHPSWYTADEEISAWSVIIIAIIMSFYIRRVFFKKKSSTRG